MITERTDLFDELDVAVALDALRSRGTLAEARVSEPEP